MDSETRCFEQIRNVRGNSAKHTWYSADSRTGPVHENNLTFPKPSLDVLLSLLSSNVVVVVLIYLHDSTVTFSSFGYNTKQMGDVQTVHTHTHTDPNPHTHTHTGAGKKIDIS